MGLIRAAYSASASVLADQWKEYFQVDSMSNEQLVVKAHKQTKGNNKGGDDIISNGAVIAVGDVLFLPYPYEIFSETALRLRIHSGRRHTLTLSCANGFNGYLPSQDQLCRGGYEVAVFRYANLFPLAPDTDNNLIQETLRIINK